MSALLTALRDGLPARYMPVRGMVENVFYVLILKKQKPLPTLFLPPNWKKTLDKKTYVE
jgi:hypothetical protein